MYKELLCVSVGKGLTCDTATTITFNFLQDEFHGYGKILDNEWFWKKKTTSKPENYKKTGPWTGVMSLTALWFHLPLRQLVISKQSKGNECKLLSSKDKI